MSSSWLSVLTPDVKNTHYRCVIENKIYRPLLVMFVCVYFCPNYALLGSLHVALYNYPALQMGTT